MTCCSSCSFSYCHTSHIISLCPQRLLSVGMTRVGGQRKRRRQEREMGNDDDGRGEPTPFSTKMRSRVQRYIWQCIYYISDPPLKKRTFPIRSVLVLDVIEVYGSVELHLQSAPCRIGPLFSLTISTSPSHSPIARTISSPPSPAPPVRHHPFSGFVPVSASASSGLSVKSSS